MEHNNEGRYRERKRARWSTARRRGKRYGENESETEHNL